MIKISIIVPIYNVEKYLEKSIDSILGQTYNDFELILVDDGSPDRCGEICDKYKELDKRIKVIHKENGGLSSARNAGLKIANGKYVGFVDSDDWIESTMYEKLYTIAEKNNCDIVQCDYIKAFNEDIHINIKSKGNVTLLNNIEALNNLYNDNVSQTIVTWSKLYKRSLFSNILFPNGKLHEDKFTTYKLLYKSKKIAMLDEKLYYYRQTPNSIMNSAFSRKNLDALLASEESINFYQSISNLDLYYKALRKYEGELINYYYKVDDLLEGNIIDIKNEIKDKYNLTFKKYISDKQIGVTRKGKSFIFFISPMIYKKIKFLSKKVYY